MKQKVFFRADGNTEIGMGHITRTLACAQMLDQNFEIFFYVFNPSLELIALIESFSFRVINAEKLLFDLNRECILVIDSYKFSKNELLNFKENAKSLILIADESSSDFVSNIVICHNAILEGAKFESSCGTKFFLGTKYLMLRHDFIQAAKQVNLPRIEVNNIFISLGGSDVLNFSGKILDLIVDKYLKVEVNLVVGSANPNLEELKTRYKRNTRVKIHYNLDAKSLVKLLQESDLAISSASVSSWEICAVGVPLIVGVWAQNQNDIAIALEKNNAGINLGWFKDGLENLTKKIDALINDFSLRGKMVSFQKVLVDGKSNIRINNIFNELKNEVADINR